MITEAKTVKEYLAGLPEDRRKAISAVRKVIRENLDKDYRESMEPTGIGYVVPHSVYPPGYHCDPKQPLPFAGIASQKNHMGIYLMCLYADPEHDAWFRKEWAKTGKKLDMGKSCVRFKKLEDLPLELIGRAIARVPAKKLIAYYESVIKATGKKKRPAKAKKKTTARSKTTSKKKTATKKKKV